MSARVESVSLRREKNGDKYSSPLVKIPSRVSPGIASRVALEEVSQTLAVVKILPFT